MAKKKPKWQTKKENKLRADLRETFKAADKLVLDLKKVKKDMMSKFPSYQGPPFSSCPPAKRRRRGR